MGWHIYVRHKEALFVNVTSKSINNINPISCIRCSFLVANFFNDFDKPRNTSRSIKVIYVHKNISRKLSNIFMNE